MDGSGSELCSIARTADFVDATALGLAFSCSKIYICMSQSGSQHYHVVHSINRTTTQANRDAVSPFAAVADLFPPLLLPPLTLNRLSSTIAQH